MPYRRHGLHFSVYDGVCGMWPLGTPKGVLIDAPNQGNLLLETLALVGER